MDVDKDQHSSFGLCVSKIVYLRIDGEVRGSLLNTGWLEGYYKVRKTHPNIIFKNYSNHENKKIIKKEVEWKAKAIINNLTKCVTIIYSGK
jgi:hypothetical protein